jgi:hypothetical protein
MGGGLQIPMQESWAGLFLGEYGIIIGIIISAYSMSLQEYHAFYTNKSTKLM